MELRIIKTDEQYRQYLREVEQLATHDPDSESKEGARLELLAKLVEDYEKDRFPFRQPDPIEAILFRMEQQGLRQKDLADILGGKNRASEVLARKRPLTLQMIRALHERLGIPSELLIREPKSHHSAGDEIDDAHIPVDLLAKRGWDIRSGAELIQRFLAPAGSPVLLRHTLTFGANSRTNRTNVWLWLSRVREVADSRSYLNGKYQRDELTRDLLRYIAKLSWMEKGPRLAKDFLEERGIALVIEPHLPGTHLDGAAMIGKSGAPVIGLTLREDRLDNFWFTLLHELIHVWKHLNNNERRAIVDESIEKFAENEKIEQEANDLAGDILLPYSVWRRSEAFASPSTKTIQALAAELQINPAVVAGRIRHERRNYALFSGLVGYRQVRRHFPEVNWG
jgi:HTH-type transcriptional regulator/antitoxin HigA